MRVYSNEALDTKIFIEFVALIVRNKYYKMLKECKDEEGLKNNYMTVPKAIRELEKIEMICINKESYRLDHAYTKEQKEILKAFGIDANYMKKEIEKITDRLRYKILMAKNEGIE